MKTKNLNLDELQKIKGGGHGSIYCRMWVHILTEDPMHGGYYHGFWTALWEVTKCVYSGEYVV